MLKTIGTGRNKVGSFVSSGKGNVSGHNGSTAAIDDYLYLGPKSKRRRVLAENGPSKGDGSTRTVDEYLDHGHDSPHRPLAFWHTPNLLGVSEHGWSKVMDATRLMWGKDTGRTYYHFVISPDPKDHVGAQECCDIAREWVTEVFPGAQAICSTHADNQGGIMHTHVVVNAVYPDTGLKIHRTKDDIEHEADVEIAICKAHGIGALPRLAEVRERIRLGEAVTESRQWSQMGEAERAMVERGARSWVHEMRLAVDESVSASTDWPEFIDAMNARGYEVAVGRRGIVYHSLDDKTGHMHRKRGEEMGTDYSEEGIRVRLGARHDEILSGTGGSGAEINRFAQTDVRAILEAHGMRARQSSSMTMTLEKWATRRYARLGRRGLARSAEGARQAARVIETIRREDITGTAQLRAKLANAAERVDAAEHTLRTLDAGTRSAGEVLRRAHEASEARDRLKGLPDGPWSTETRRLRNELLSKAEENEGFCKRQLARASVWIRENGLETETLAVQAAGLNEAYRMRAEALSDEVAGLTERLERLSAVSEALGETRYDHSEPMASKKPLRIVAKKTVDKRMAPRPRQTEAMDRARKAALVMCSRVSPDELDSLARVLPHGDGAVTEPRSLTPKRTRVASEQSAKTTMSRFDYRGIR